MKPAIAMIVKNYYDIDARVRRYAEALIEAGYSVDVIAVKADQGGLVKTVNNVRVYQVPIVKLGKTVIGNIFESGFFAILSFIWISFLYIKKNYEIVHVHNMPDFLVFSALIPKLFGSKVLIDIHDPFPELYNVKFKPGLIGFSGKLLLFEEKISLNFADHIIASTELIKIELTDKGFKPGKITPIINIPDSSMFDPDKYSVGFQKSSNGQFTLLFAGTIAKRNGLGNVVNALTQLKDTIPEICYRVLGEGEYTEELKETVNHLGLSNFVEIKNLVSLEKIPEEILKAKAVVWFPEMSEFMNMALSVKVMEALSMGIPVISTRTRCHEFYYNNGEVIFTDSSDIREIVEAINNLYKNYSKYKPTQYATKKFNSKFNWQNEKEKYLQLVSSFTYSYNE